jgi:hypothetical protein
MYISVAKGERGERRKEMTIDDYWEKEHGTEEQEGAVSSCT